MSNEYQEALNRVATTCKNFADYEMGLDMATKEDQAAIYTLQVLVDKETPKKTIRTPYKDIYGNKLEDSKTHYYNGCPVCKNNVGIDAKYCRHCGQKIDY